VESTSRHRLVWLWAAARERPTIRNLIAATLAVIGPLESRLRVAIWTSRWHGSVRGCVSADEHDAPRPAAHGKYFRDLFGRDVDHRHVIGWAVCRVERRAITLKGQDPRATDLPQSIRRRDSSRCPESAPSCFGPSSRTGVFRPRPSWCPSVARACSRTTSGICGGDSCCRSALIAGR
jgi:hypothetical protein